MMVAYLYFQIRTKALIFNSKYYLFLNALRIVAVDLV